MIDGEVPSSFRDPSGFVFWRDGALYRQVNAIYKEHYDHLMNSGLYESLVDGGLLIPHMELSAASGQPSVVQDTDDGQLTHLPAYKILKPEVIPFISYPYEWCFSQLKDAALTLLAIQEKALEFDMSLKDASAYNIQFRNGKPVLIDTLSFERYCEGRPWVAYRQFCQHFLAPLALMSHTDIRLHQLLRIYIDGVPLDLASQLLPARSRFSFSLLSHIHLHARSQKYFADKTPDVHRHRLSRFSFAAFIDGLQTAIHKLTWRPQGTVWADYEQADSYSGEALGHKLQLVSAFLDHLQPKTVWDLGANTGRFSRLASSRGAYTISCDSDPAAVEKNYLHGVREGDRHLLPLVIDLVNPSPNMGWENRERMSLLERGPADTVLALALIHHLTISNNIPLPKLADFLSKICSSLIIEFIPKSDPKVQKLLSTREDIFLNYTPPAFERAFERHFTIGQPVRITNAERTLYLMRRRQG